MTTTSIQKPKIVQRDSLRAYDYTNQAWIILTETGQGIYMQCNHPKPCDCYGSQHSGEIIEIA